MLRIVGADIRPVAKLAHQVTLGRIVTETPDLRELVTNPNTFFLERVKHLSGTRREVALESLIAWIRWGDIVSGTMHSGKPECIVPLTISRCRSA